MVGTLVIVEGKWRVQAAFLLAKGFPSTYTFLQVMLIDL